jgi:hypothetical protein
MAIVKCDPVLGEPAMRHLHGQILNCPEPVLLTQAGHFVPEQREMVAELAVKLWSIQRGEAKLAWKTRHGVCLYAQMLGLDGYAAVPRPSASSLMPLRRPSQAPGQRTGWFAQRMHHAGMQSGL